MQAIGANAGLPLPLLWMDYQAHCVLLAITAPEVSVDSVTLILASSSMLRKFQGVIH